MLNQHQFYVYYEGPVVYARAGNRERVQAQEFQNAQEAHDLVQSIINPEGHEHTHFHKPDAGGNSGFHHADFQNAISSNCESFVREAYKKAGIEL